MISYCFSNPHARSHHHTPPAKKHMQLYSKWKWGTRLRLHLNISLSLNADTLSCLYLFSHHTQALRLSACQIHSSACTALLPLHVRCSSVYQPHTLCQSSPPASTVTLGRHLVKLYSLWWKDVLIPIHYFYCSLAATAVVMLQCLGCVKKNVCSQKTMAKGRGLFQDQDSCPLLVTICCCARSIKILIF